MSELNPDCHNFIGPYPCCSIITGDAKELAPAIPDESVDLIFTDPPYPHEFLPLYSLLSSVANRVLKDGKLSLAYAGKTALPEVIKRLDESLCYYWLFDIHEPGGRELRFDSIEEYQIPFRCLLPQTVENMVIAGRCISCDHESLGTIRTIPTCMYTGQAAGVAAAVAVRQGILFRTLDIVKIQDALIAQKAVIHEPLLDRLKLAT